MIFIYSSVHLNSRFNNDVAARLYLYTTENLHGDWMVSFTEREKEKADEFVPKFLSPEGFR